MQNTKVTEVKPYLIPRDRGGFSKTLFDPHFFRQYLTIFKTNNRE